MILFYTFLIAVLVYTAKKEYEFIFFFGEHKNLLPDQTTNAVLIDNSVKTIFTNKFGECIAFLYPITFLVTIVAMWWYTHNNGTSNIYTSIYLIITGAIIALHVVIPYYFTYLRFYEQALLHGMDQNLQQWIDMATNTVGRINTVEIQLTKPYLAPKKTFTLQEYDEYNSLLNELPFDTSGLRPLTKQEYIKILPHVGEKELIYGGNGDNLVDLYFSDDKVEKSDVEFGISVLGMSIMKKQNMKDLLNGRYSDIALFFSVFEIIKYFTK